MQGLSLVNGRIIVVHDVAGILGISFMSVQSSLNMHSLHHICTLTAEWGAERELCQHVLRLSSKA
jgi:hypothetical protein